MRLGEPFSRDAKALRSGALIATFRFSNFQTGGGVE